MSSKMIVITVKTLDSQNHVFNVEEDMTVEQFKAHIADTVNIPAATQRIIYCGRVLQDTGNLKDYDVDGKVVHLVQRAPPSSNARSQSQSSHSQRRVVREHGNTMFLGSMAFPSNIVESQPSLPSHSLAGSRLNVARRMLRRAEHVINLLENPTSRPTEQTPPEETQDEVTPVIEAQVIVPSTNNMRIDEAMVLSAVQNTLLSGAAGAGQVPPRNVRVTISEHSIPTTSQESEASVSSASPVSPPSTRPVPTSLQNLPSTTAESETASSTEPSPSTSSLPENASRTTEMAELLSTLAQLQGRFAPFLERYHNFMQDDPEATPETHRSVQTTLHRVSEVFHFLGHAYHSLSDIIIRVRTPPPRPLLCRPILIQHSAIVQTGIPMQVEAQINISDRPPTASGSTTSATASTENVNSSSTNSAENTQSASGEGNPQMVGVPLMPMNAVRVQSFPVEIRSITIPHGMTSGRGTGQNNNNNNTPAAASQQQAQAQTAGDAASSATTATTSPSTTSAATGGAAGAFNLANPNVEFFMEVTPEGITIDSLETALIGPNQADDLLRGVLNLNSQSPETIQSIMQVVGNVLNSQLNTQFGGRAPSGNRDGAQASQPQTTPAATGTTSSGQNSQARGNTQTNPTTSTRTRSTSRPHVHLHQQTMQGGFDPFLPCNSHHLANRRRFVAPSAQSVPSQNSSQPAQQPRQSQQQSGGGGTARSEPQTPNNSLMNLMNGIINSIRGAYQRRSSQTASAPQATPAASSGAAGGSGEGTDGGASANNRSTSVPSFFSMSVNSGLQGPTIAQVLQQLSDDSLTTGESIISDLVTLLAQNLTIGDLVTMNNGRFEPLNRIANDIRNFVTNRLLDGSTATENIEMGVDRLIAEMRPFLDSLSQMPSRINIDIVGSAESLFRHHLPNIIRLSISLQDTTNLRTIINVFEQTITELVALALYASTNGSAGVESVFDSIVIRCTQGIPRELQEWTSVTSRRHFAQCINSSLAVPHSTISPYIVQRGETISQTDLAAPKETTEEPVEAMDLDEPEASASGSDMSVSPPLRLEDTAGLPSIIIGSEGWHGQVPADWVPLITRDVQRQRRQNTQPPFSDAYLSGMPSKRRKLVHAVKPQGNLSQIITDSVRRAVTATGLSTVAPIEAVAEAAGSSEDIQEAYRNLMKSSVQTSLKDNANFTPERFPNASNYFNGP